MKKCYLLFLILTISYTTPFYPQETKDSSTAKLGTYVFNYAVSYLSDFRAVLYLYRSELEKDPKNIDDIKNFIDQYRLNFSLNKSDSIIFHSNEDGSSLINFTFISDVNYKHKMDTLLIKSTSGFMKLGAPLSKGSSITSLYGEITAGVIETESGNTILLQPTKSTIYYTRIDLETIKRIANIE